MHYIFPISILPYCALLFPLVSHPVKQDADGGSLQDKAQILWRRLILKAEGVVGFYGQKSPSDKGTSAYLHRMISLFFAPLLRFLSKTNSICKASLFLQSSVIA